MKQTLRANRPIGRDGGAGRANGTVPWSPRSSRKDRPLVIFKEGPSPGPLSPTRIAIHCEALEFRQRWQGTMNKPMVKSTLSALPFLFILSASVAAEDFDKLEEFLVDRALRSPGGDPGSPAALAARALGDCWANPEAPVEVIEEEVKGILLLLGSGQRKALTRLSTRTGLPPGQRRQELLEIVGAIKICPECGEHAPLSFVFCTIDGKKLASVEPGTKIVKWKAGSLTRPEFTFLRRQKFKSGGETHEVEIYQHDGLRAALSPGPGVPALDCEFVLVPRGKFEMGSDPGDSTSAPDERPRHRVKIDSFLMARVEVSQRLWTAVMGTTPEEHVAGERASRRIDGVAELNAMVNLSFEDATALARKTSARLPSESEWEYACRAGTNTRFSCGDSITTDLANYNGRYVTEYSPAGASERVLKAGGSYPPNAFGLHDLHGSVFEWCQDTLQPGSKGAPDDDSAWVVEGNPVRVHRGGSHVTGPDTMRSACRRGKEKDKRLGNVGARLVFDVKE